MSKKNLFSSGEFAKMNGINKRTLHYYNDIGLFCPAVIDENGYHYYSSFQSIKLEMILIFRKQGLSIDDIKTYTNSPSDTSFLQMIADKKKADRQIHRTALRGQIIFAGKTEQTRTRYVRIPWQNRTY